MPITITITISTLIMPNKINQVFFLTLLVAILLILLSAFGKEANYKGFRLKKINILADILPDSLKDNYIAATASDAFVIDSSLMDIQPEDTTETQIPPTPIDAPLDTAAELQKNNPFLNKRNSKIANDTTIPKPSKDALLTDEDLANIKASSTTNYLEDYTPEGDALNMLLANIRAYKNAGQKVRIAFLADSFVEGDIMLGYLRDLLQTEWGGNGVGFVPVASPSAHFRNSITHTFSKNWTTHSILDAGKASPYLGISGYCHQPDALGSWVSYKTTNAYKNNTYFNQVRLFYINPNNPSATVKYSLNKGETIEKGLEQGEQLHELLIKGEDKIKGIDMYFNSPDIYVYGASLEGNSGVYVDNFSVRGVSGPQLKRISSQMFEEFNEKQNYSLVVLQYGLNVSFPTQAHLDNYIKVMNVAIAHVKKSFPNTPIMLFSVSDRSSNQNGEYTTIEGLDKMISTQRNMAKKYQLLFWDMHSAMGGNNAMLTYVKNGWANKDYTHLNFKGGKEIAKLFAKVLLKEE